MEQLPKNLLPDEASPEWLNKGDNAWQLTAATLVGLQSIPGLVILYGSMVKKKWAINAAFMAFYAFAMVIVCWVGWGFRMSFGDKLVAFLGKPAVALDEKFLLGQAFLGYFPTATMVLFQGVFACITLILIAGALLGRMNFRAWILFVPLWLTCSYTIAAFSIWCPDGWLAKLGVIDFAGGYVIHVSSGAGLLWMGWSGFNGGAPFAVSADASLAVLNTHVCTATSLLTWLLLDYFFFGKPSVIGAVQGMITGLVCITPAAGWAAILMGIISGSVPWYTMMVLHNKLKLLRLVDDPMALIHTHALTGTLGGILTGFFAVPKLCRLFYMVPDWEKYIGLAYGLQNGRTSAGFKQMGIQVAGLAFVICLNISTTSLICWLIRAIVPLRMTDEELQIGDEVVHGEEAFALFGDGMRFQNSKNNSIYDADEFSYATSRSLGDVQMV
ncbi:hypothetical protein Patl1_23307 [Pistacia atlantica]|uniref:Uncharacterized protein n=1 Tax=Pistacia atlantica TaxID=434234 RepID=A0ACC1A1E4_9ROSI|nr:hypothetical protein Patl1_23307 [Pistacia atlantica]